MVRALRLHTLWKFDHALWKNMLTIQQIDTPSREIVWWKDGLGWNHSYLSLWRIRKGRKLVGKLFLGGPANFEMLKLTMEIVSRPGPKFRLFSVNYTFVLIIWKHVFLTLLGVRFISCMRWSLFTDYWNVSFPNSFSICM